MPDAPSDGSGQGLLETRAGKAGLLQRWRERLERDPRIARMVHGSLSGLLGRGLGVLISLISLPLTVRYLGKLEYGVWVTISTSVVMLAVLDLGIANTLTNFISEAYAAEDQGRAQQYYATAFWVSVAVVLFLTPVCWLAWYSIDWGALLHLKEGALIAQARLCAAIAAAMFLVGLPLNLVNRVFAGYQEVHLANYFAIGNNVLSLAALLVVIALRGSIVALMAAYCAAALLGTLSLNLWLFLRHKPWMRPLPWKARPGIARLLVGQGSLFFILQLTNLVVFYSDNLVITHYLGAAEVTPYSLAYRLTSYAGLLQALVVPSLWPALTEAYQKGDLTWVRRMYRAITRKSLIAIAIAAVLLAIAGRPIIRVLAGSSTVPSELLLCLMAAFSFVMAVTSNQALLLNASSRLRLETVVAVLAAIANLYFSIYLVQRIGSVGVILSSIGSFLVFMYFPQAWEVRGVLAGRYLRDAESK